ncbi:hypothetical protein R9X47_22750 [Wukongibacter baidiensis]|uniref:hypothetical protein n=1 Tax=Wukongibacter baidiensis TaxID=1723361 RepID=UPI003D7FC27F
MINIRKYTIKYISLLIVLDIVVIIIRMYGYKSIDFLVIPQLILTLVCLLNEKSKLYDLLKKERKEILTKYKFVGKYSTWELNIIKAASETKDLLLMEVRNKVVTLNLVSLLFRVSITPSL